VRSEDLVRGKRYAWRKAARPGMPIERVRFLGEGHRKAGVEFETGERAGQRDFVIFGQIVAPWSQAKDIRAEDEARARLEEAASPAATAEEFATTLVLDMFDANVARQGVPGGLVVERERILELAEYAGLDGDDVAGPPSFTDRKGRFLFAVDAAHRLAQALAEHDAAQILAAIDDAERRGVSRDLGEAIESIKRWTGITVGELRRLEQSAEEEQRIRRAMVEVRSELDRVARNLRENLDLVAGEVEQLSERVDKLLEGDD
jgi:hypothetical protein